MRSTQSVKVWKMGSDPEFGMMDNRGWRQLYIPANTILTNNRELGLHSPIGVDGHASTGELRPPPCKNVWHHLWHIGNMLLKINDHLSKHKKGTGVTILSSPYVANEPFGGHIHTSFFVKSPIQFAPLLEHYTLLPTGEVNRTTNDGRGDRLEGNALSRLASDYHRLLTDPESKVFSYDQYAMAMDYLLMPLEWWLQPWFLRQERNQRYGARNTDQIRFQKDKKRPATTLWPLAKGWSYHHVEYRTPSSWLKSPDMAYLYLATAKLSLLNYNAILEMPDVTDTLPYMLDRNNNTERNHEFRALYIKRLTTLLGQNVIMSKDLQSLYKKLDIADGQLDSWLNPFGPVDMTAWRNLAQGD